MTKGPGINFEAWREDVMFNLQYFSFYFVTSISILLTTWLKHDNFHKRVVTEYQQKGPNSNNFVASE